MHGALFTVFKTLPTLGSLAMYLSPAPRMYNIYKTKTTGEMLLLPIVCMFTNCHMWVMYGLFVDDVFPLSTSMFIGECFALLYTVIFTVHTADRKAAFTIITVSLCTIALATLYALLSYAGVTGQSNHSIGLVLGYVGIATTLVFFSSPLATIRRVLRTKSAASIPIPLCAMGMTCNTLWIIYALIVTDTFILVPNVVALCFTLSQVLLYIKYNPNKLPDTTPKGDAASSPTFEVMASPLQPVGHGSSDVQQRV